MHSSLTLKKDGELHLNLTQVTIIRRNAIICNIIFSKIPQQSDTVQRRIQIT